MADDPTRFTCTHTASLASLTKRVKRATELMEEETSLAVIHMIRDEVRLCVDRCQAANDDYVALLTEEAEISDTYLWFVEADDRGLECVRQIVDYCDGFNAHADHDSGASPTNVKPDGQNANIDTKVVMVPITNQQGSPDTSPVTQSPAPAIDEWIDRLDPLSETVVPPPTSSASQHERALRTAHERNEPRVELVTFNGSPMQWSRFVEWFYEQVHRQPFSSDTDADGLTTVALYWNSHKITEGLGSDGRAYAPAHQYFKLRFGHKSLVAQAYLDRVSKGTIVPERERNALETFYISIRECLFTLIRIAYNSDLNSLDSVRQAIRHLPPRLRERWAEQYSTIRANPV